MSGALKKTSLKKELHHLCILLFVSSFLLQQVIAFSHPAFPPSSCKAGARCYASSQTFHVRPATSSPEQFVCPYIDIEIEPTGSDDNEGGELYEAGLLFSLRHVSKEIAFSKALSIRLQQLASHSQRQEPVPVFILHHSWKAHLA